MSTGLHKAEGLLVDSLKWLIPGLQLTGYFPFVKSKGQLVLQNWRTPLFFWSSLLIVLSCLHIYTFLSHFDAFKGDVVTKSVEKIVIQGLAVLMILVANFNRIFSFTRGEHIRKFWMKQCNMLEFVFFRKPGIDGDTGTLQKLLNDLKVSSKRSVLCYIAFVAFMSCINSFSWTRYFANMQALSPNASTWLILKLLSSTIFWVFVSYIDYFFWLWICHFLGLFNSTLSFLRDETSHLCQEMGLTIFPVPVHEEQMRTEGRGQFATKVAHVLDSYLTVERAVDELNSIYGYIIVMEIGVSVGYILVYTFCGINALFTPNFEFVATVTLWVMIFMVRVLSIASESSITCVKSKDLAKELLLLSRARVQIGDNLTHQALAVSLRMIIHYPQLRPGHFFALDRRLMMGIFSAITTYLVILLQIRQAETQDLV